MRIPATWVPETGAPRPLRFAVIVVLSVLCLAASRPAAGLSCEESKAPPGAAAVTDLRSSGDDVVVDLAADPTLGQVVAELYRGETHMLGSATVPLFGDGRATVTFPNALAGGESLDLQYFVQVKRPAGAAVMEPFPFKLLFDCLQGPCSYRLVRGLRTTGLWLSEALAGALAGRPPCQLEANLLSLLDPVDPLQRPLAAAAQTLLAQLARRDLLGPAGACVFAWQTVYPEAIEEGRGRLLAHELHRAGSWISEGRAEDHGATSCVQLQGTSAADTVEAFSFPGGEGLESVTELELGITCVGGPSSCGYTSCVGDVEAELDYRRVACVEAMVCDDATGGSGAGASSSHSLSVRLGQRTLLEGELLTAAVDADSPGEVVEDKQVDGDIIASPSALTPARAHLSGQTLVDYASESPGYEKATYSIAESSLEFALRLSGSGAACATAETSLTTLQSLELGARGGGLKMRRWWPPDDGGGDPERPLRSSLCIGHTGGSDSPRFPG
ncbi:MAG: hypothetical protein AAGF23_08170 [Acidobacteriota bacterium]